MSEVCFICHGEDNIRKSCDVCTAKVHTKCWKEYIHSKHMWYVKLLGGEYNFIYCIPATVDCPICKTETLTKLPPLHNTRSITEAERQERLFENIRRMTVKIREENDKRGEYLKKLGKILVENRIILKDVEYLANYLQMLYEVYGWADAPSVHRSIYGYVDFY